MKITFLPKERPCRHRNFWVLGNWMWCWRCGALRDIERIDGNAFRPRPGSRWTRPVGPHGENPLPRG